MSRVRVWSIAFAVAALACLPLQAQRSLANLSVRTELSGSSRPMLHFTVEGSVAKSVLLRAVGPSLASFGVRGTVADPKLTVYDRSGTSFATNQGWGGATAVAEAAARVGAFSLAAGSKDAALLLSLGAGTYTVEIASASSGNGQVLLEIYDADASSAARLVYVSVQCRIASAQESAVVGFVLAGSSATNMLVRAVGPAMTAAGMGGMVADPQLSVSGGAGGFVGSNLDWVAMADLTNATSVAGLLPLAIGSKDAATMLSLAPGPYIVQVTSGSGGAGDVLIEMAQVDSNRAATFVPAILVPPRPATGASGGSVTFAAPAVGRPTPSFQWLKAGMPISGATQSSLTLNSLQSSDAATYSVVMSNPAGTVVSAGFGLGVTSGPPPASVAPTLTVPPAAQSVPLGATATFQVVATGTAPLTYQWLFNGTPLAGATQATLAVPASTKSAEGEYSVRVSNSGGSVTSSPARLTVLQTNTTRVYFGEIGANDGTFALLVRPDGTGALLGYIRATKSGLISRDVVFNGITGVRGTAAMATIPTSSGTMRFEGAIAGNSVMITFPGTSFALTGGAPVTSGPMLASAGFYEAGVQGQSARGYAIVAPSGDIYALAATTALVDAGRGIVERSGAFALLGENLSRVAGLLRPPFIDFTLLPATGGGTALALAGADSHARSDTETLINVSTLSQTAAGADALTAGFVVTGVEPKTVLIRGIGPSLSAFGVTGALTAARLEVARDGARIALADDWGSGSDPAAIASAAARVGAFALASDSRDAALLLRLNPGAYTATVTGQGGASGVGLVEVYDASVAPVAKSERIMNVSSRALVGPDDVLIAGFVVRGTVPKRVLVRGVGPMLASFGVTDALPRSRVAVYSGGNVVAENERWGLSPDMNAIVSAGTQVGAFPLQPPSPDAAVLVHLAPGAYTARVSGVGTDRGIALVEVYEVP